MSEKGTLHSGWTSVLWMANMLSRMYVGADSSGQLETSVRISTFAAFVRRKSAIVLRERLGMEERPSERRPGCAGMAARRSGVTGLLEISR